MELTRVRTCATPLTSHVEVTNSRAYGFLNTEVEPPTPFILTIMLLYQTLSRLACVPCKQIFEFSFLHHFLAIPLP